MSDTSQPNQKCNCHRAIYIRLGLGCLLFSLLVLLVLFEISVHKQLARQSQTLDEATWQLHSTQQQLQQLQHTIALFQKTTGDLRLQLTVVNQLVQLAYYNSTYLHDWPGAIQALSQAGQLLHPLSPHHKLIANIHQHLRILLKHLQNLPVFNPVDLLTELAKLQSQLPTLPLRITQMSYPISPASSGLSHSWYHALDNSLSILKKLVTIRYIDQPISPCLLQGQHEFLQHTLYWSLQKAQWAVLHIQPTLYHASLQQAQRLIQTYFSCEAPSTRAVLQSMDQLQQVKLSSYWPDFAPLLHLLQQMQSTSQHA